MFKARVAKPVQTFSDFTGLLRNIAGEVISRGQASVDVNRIWEGDVTEPMESLNNAIQCGIALNKTFRQISTLIKTEGKAPCNWDFADGAAFAEVTPQRSRFAKYEKK